MSENDFSDKEHILTSLTSHMVMEKILYLNFHLEIGINYDEEVSMMFGNVCVDFVNNKVTIKKSDSLFISEEEIHLNTTLPLTPESIMEGVIEIEDILLRLKNSVCQAVEADLLDKIKYGSNNEVTSIPNSLSALIHKSFEISLSDD